MGYVDVAHVSLTLPDGRVLLDDVSFRVGEGATVALVGANGTGKTTLLRLIAGDVAPSAGTIARSGGLGVMRQFIGSVRDATTVRELLLLLAPPPIREAGERLELAGATMLLLDEPTDNLDVVSAEALEDGLAGYRGTVLAVTHDRWFARGFDRYVVFGADGAVYESPEPVWDAGVQAPARAG